MAIVCDICGKGARTRGAGKRLFLAQWAMSSCDGFSVHFEPASAGTTLYRNRGARAICGVCLDKLGVPEMLAEDADRASEREVDVTPGQLTGARRTRLLKEGA